jgi:hypothetical protein
MSVVGYRVRLQRNAETKNKEIPKMAKAKTAEKATSNTQPKKASTKKATPAVSVELSPEGLTLLTAFKDAKKAEAQAKEAKEQAELALREILGDHKEATLNGITVLKVVGGKNTHFDRKMMEEIYPEAFMATLRETLYTYLKTL